MLDDERRHSRSQHPADWRRLLKDNNQIVLLPLPSICTYNTMSSAKSFALKALRSNIASQRLSKTLPAQFQNSLVKAQPFQRTAPRPAFVPVRWHSIPASARGKDYDFTQVKEFATSPSEDRLLIGTPKHPKPPYIPPTSANSPILQTSASPPNTKQALSLARSTFP